LFSTPSTPGSTPEFPRNILDFFLSGKGRIRGFCRWRCLAWKRTGMIGDCGGRRGGRGGWAGGVRGVAENDAGIDRGACPSARARRWDRESLGCIRHGIVTVQHGRDAGFPPECDRATRSSALQEHRVDHQGDAEFVRIERGRSTDAVTRIEDRDGRIRAMQDSSASSASGQRDPGPSVARTDPSGGGFSPRSGRRSPIGVLSGGQAAPCRISHQRRPPPLELPAGS